MQDPVWPPVTCRGSPGSYLAARQGPAQHIETQPGAPAQEESLGCGDSLTKPEQVDQQ
jgi:hypothetical protein